MPSKQASPREGEGRSVAERMAREIIPKWTNASAANTMEYENALEAQMMEGHGPVEGLLHAVYTGDVNEAVEGFLKFQPLELGGAGSDEEGPNEVDEATEEGAGGALLGGGQNRTRQGLVRRRHGRRRSHSAQAARG